jgi:FkbM family methyltransferase
LRTREAVRAGLRGLACSPVGGWLERPLLVVARRYERLRVPLFRAYFKLRFEEDDRVLASRLHNGLRFSARTSDHPQKQILVAGIWEPSISAHLLSVLRRGDVVIDVGANTGYYTLLAANKVGPEGLVIAIEPTADTFALLRTNVDQNMFADRTILLQCAATASTGEKQLFGFSGNSGLNTLVPTDGASSGEVVLGRPLDELVPPNLRRRIKVIKIDVEGAEMDVLIGAEGVLADLPDAAQLIIEVKVDLLGKSEAVDCLRSRGFNTFLFRNLYQPLGEQMLQTSARLPQRQDFLPSGQADVLFLRSGDG